MPGIAGIISRRSPEACQHLVNTMIGCMKHEPFYVPGTCFVPEIGVYGGWVAHEGTFAAAQSTHRNHNDVALLFSGECFPAMPSPKQHASTEHHRNEYDVDQLLCFYEKEGDEFVEQMNGLFSGLLIDKKRKRALLFNDRYGVERIYFYEKDETTYFASEAKALLRILPELRAFDDEGVSQFLTFGCTLDGMTLFRNLKFMPGGSLWVFGDGLDNRKKQYFLPENWESQSTLTEEDFELEFMETFRRVMPRYVSSNSPIGIALTGGLDTRMIMACLPKNTVKPLCYTFSGLTDKLLDLRLAARVAQVCGLEHQPLRIGKDFLSNYGHYVDRTVFVTDGCGGPLGAHEVYFNSQARQLSRVRLTGNYGSEILRSMSTFKPVGVSDGLVNDGFRKMLDSTLMNISNKIHIHPVTFSAFQEIPWNLFGMLVAGRSQLIFRTPYLDNEIVALAYRAPVSSRQSPRSALRLVNEFNPELGRIPTDRGLLWGSHGISYMMGRLFSEVTFKLDYLHKEGLPNWLSPLDPAIGNLSYFGILGLHKFLPYRRWFQAELSTYIESVLTDAHTQHLPYLNSRFLSSIVADHVRGRKNYIREIHAVLTLEAAERLLIRGSS